MISPKKNKMPTLDAATRAANFDEVALGYSPEIAVAEAERCLNCKNKPCVSGCPVKIDIPSFIDKIKKKDFEGAYETVSLSSALPAVCGRVCPQETQCESKCTLGIKFEPVGIGRLERFVADYHNKSDNASVKIPEQNGHKVAVVGSGPSGLTCAGELAKKGYAVEKEVEGLKKIGVDILTNVIIGKTLTIDELFDDGYEAVFIGSGAGLPNFMNIEGESLNGVLSANEFLTRVNLMKAYKKGCKTPVLAAKKTVVVGGGNVAMDAARCAKRLGADVTIVYRRTEKELPARKEEVEHAKEEGIKFELLTNPVKILGDENRKVNKMTCIKMELSAPDESGRARPVPVSGSEFDIECDCVIMALGTSPNPLIRNTTKGLEVQSRGGIIVNEDGLTSREGVYAGGDAVTGAATVILAMGAGKNAAFAIDKYLKNK